MRCALRKSLFVEIGGSRIGNLFWILILLAGVWVGSQVIPFYYYEKELLGHMEAQAKKAEVLTDSEIRKNLLRTIHKLEIPIDHEDDLRINRAQKKIIIELQYNEVLFLDLGEDRIYDLHIFDFHPRVETSY